MANELAAKTDEYEQPGSHLLKAQQASRQQYDARVAPLMGPKPAPRHPVNKYAGLNAPITMSVKNLQIPPSLEGNRMVDRPNYAALKIEGSIAVSGSALWQMGGRKEGFEALDQSLAANGDQLVGNFVLVPDKKAQQRLLKEETKPSQASNRMTAVPTANSMAAQKRKPASNAQALSNRASRYAGIIISPAFI